MTSAPDAARFRRIVLDRFRRPDHRPSLTRGGGPSLYRDGEPLRPYAGGQRPQRERSRQPLARPRILGESRVSSTGDPRRVRPDCPDQQDRGASSRLLAVGPGRVQRLPGPVRLDRRPPRHRPLPHPRPTPATSAASSPISPPTCAPKSAAATATYFTLAPRVPDSRLPAAMWYALAGLEVPLVGPLPFATQTIAQFIKNFMTIR